MTIRTLSRVVLLPWHFYTLFHCDFRALFDENLMFEKMLMVAKQFVAE